MKKKLIPYLIIALAVSIFYLPIFIKPYILLDRGNDLQEVFWPVFYFIRQNILINHQLPLWNNLFFAGTPILPDPQFSLFYPPNFLFYFLPTSIAFIVHIFIHLLLGACGMYFLTKEIFSLDKKASIFASVLYILTPRVSGYLEAGHFSLIAAYAWLPFLIASAVMLTKKPKFKWILLYSVSLAGLFYTHTLIFLSALILSLLLIFFLYLYSKNKNIKTLIFATVGLIIAFGLVAITLLPQLSWSSLTTRFLLIDHPKIYPEWLTIKEFFFSILFPYMHGLREIWQTGTEKWLTLGIIPFILSVIGFFKVKKKYRVLIFILVAGISILALNNLLPGYSFFVKQKWFTLLRVTTRLWYINNFITAVLGGVAINTLIKAKKKLLLTNLIILLALGEVLTLSWIYIFKPPYKNLNLAPKQVFEFLGKDSDRFRVFCTTRCLSQQESAKYNLELVEGYNTLQQTNYFKQSWQLMGGFWNYYTLAVPPVDTSITNQIQPDAKALGEYNTKYIVSPYKLTDSGFELVDTTNNFLIYQNNFFIPRASVPITLYTPNHIRLDTKDFSNNQIILSEVYSPGWKAYLNESKEVRVQETPNGLRAVDITTNTKLVDLKYLPNGYVWGMGISLTTIFILIGFFFLKKFSFLN
ncbi:hypothetical protein ACFL1Q_00535 [Patescibacteria group bacterium]